MMVREWLPLAELSKLSILHHRLDGRFPHPFVSDEAGGGGSQLPVVSWCVSLRTRNWVLVRKTVLHTSAVKKPSLIAFNVV